MTKKTVEEFKKAGGLANVPGRSQDHLFVVCASYEPRSIAVAQCLATTYRAERGLVYFNREFLEGRSKDKVQANIGSLLSILEDHCDEIDKIEGSWLDPKDQFEALRAALASNSCDSTDSGLSITLDTSTFIREALLNTVSLIRNSYPSAVVRTTYVSPKDHGEWLSRGFRSVRSVMGFPGIQRASCPTIVMALSGFESDRLLKIIEEYEPVEVLLGVGDPPTAKRFLQRNLEEQKLVLARQDFHEFRFSADCISDCSRDLEAALQSRLSDYNVILAPLSTKPSTLSCLVVAERHPEIQVVYCVPGEYNVDDYSRGVDSIFVDEMPREEG